MTRKQKGIAVGAAALLLVLSTGGFALFHMDDKKTHNQQANSGQAVSQNEIPLNQAGNVPDSSGGLSVSSAGSASMGQLNGNQDSSQGSNSGGSSGSGLPDPSSFGQYEKYKDGSSALFGDIQKGSGDELAANKKAAVYYKGYLTNGQLFDQSRAGSDGKLQPFIFTEGAHQVIPGWEQGTLGMKVGGVRLIIVPPAVGYGAQGQASIPPNSVLVFIVQLLEVQ